MDKYTLVIIVSTVAFFVLAAILLVPVYLFLKKEEKVSEQWTGDAIARQVESRYSKGSDAENNSEDS